MRILALNIIITLALGIELSRAATVPNRYVTNTDDVATSFNRLKLNGPFTLFVSTNGSDANAGTNSTSPLLTIQAAVNKAATYDLGTNNLTIQLSNGLYPGSVFIGQQVSTSDWKERGGMLVIHGNDAAPTSVVLTNASTNHLVIASQGSRVIIASVYLVSTNQNNECLLDSQFFSYLGFSNVVLGACGASEAQLVAEANGSLEALGPYIVSGGGAGHALALGHGTVYIEHAVTFTNTPVFSIALARAYNGGALFMVGPFTGSVTGPRYNLTESGSALFSFGTGSMDALPGSVDGIQNLDLGQGVATRSTLQSTLIITNVLSTNVDVDSVRLEKYGNDVNGPSLSSFHSRGSTAGAQAAVTTDDRLLFVGAGGSDGAAFQTNKAMMSFNAESPWAAASNATYILFQTTAPNNTQRSNAFRLNGDHTLATFGFNTLALGTIVVGSSPFTYTTTGTHSEFVYITGGTTSAITVNGTQVASVDTGCVTVNLQPGESVVVTYTVAPTMKRKPY